MRFAGQRFRNSRQARPNGAGESGRNPDFRANASVQGLEQAMTNMPDKNVAQMSFTQMPDMVMPPKRARDGSEPEFRASGRI